MTNGDIIFCEYTFQFEVAVDESTYTDTDMYCAGSREWGTRKSNSGIQIKRRGQEASKEGTSGHNHINLVCKVYDVIKEIDDDGDAYIDFGQWISVQACFHMLYLTARHDFPTRPL